MKNLKLTLALAAIGLIAQAQPYTGMTTYPNGTPALLSSGGRTSSHSPGFLMAGYIPATSAGAASIYLNKTDPTGLFTGATEFQQSYLLAANTSNCSGTITQQLTCYGVSAIETRLPSNSRFYAMVSAFNAGCSFALLDPSGNPMLNSLFHFPATATAPTKPVIVESIITPNTYYVCGSYLDGQIRRMYILKVTNGATLIWTRLYELGAGRPITPTAIIESPFSSTPQLVVVGIADYNIATLGTEAFFLRVDGTSSASGGTIIQFQTYGSGSSANEEFQSIAVAVGPGTAPIGYIIGGYTDVATAARAWMTQVGPAANVIWSSRINPSTTGASSGGRVVGVTSRYSNFYAGTEYYGTIVSAVGTLVAKLNASGGVFSSTTSEFVYNTSSISLPAAITNVDLGGGVNDGIHVYGTNATSPGDFVLTQACFSGASGSCTAAQQTLTNLTSVITGPSATTPPYIPNVLAGLVNCTNVSLAPLGNSFSPNALCPTTSLPTSPYVGSNARSAVATGLNNLQAGAKDLSLQPNPVTDKLSIVYTSTTKETIKIEIFNSLGQLVKTIEESSEAGENNLSIDFNSLNVESGIYFINTTINGTTGKNKILYTK